MLAVLDGEVEAETDAGGAQELAGAFREPRLGVGRLAEIALDGGSRLRVSGAEIPDRGCCVLDAGAGLGDARVEVVRDLRDALDPGLQRDHAVARIPDDVRVLGRVAVERGRLDIGARQVAARVGARRRHVIREDIRREHRLPDQRSDRVALGEAARRRVVVARAHVVEPRRRVEELALEEQRLGRERQSGRSGWPSRCRRRRRGTVSSTAPVPSLSAVTSPWPSVCRKNVPPGVCIATGPTP